jgi:iron complex outermembrane receptor protein
MQEFKFLINARQLLTVSAWLNSNARNLPAFDPSTPGKSSQLDQAQRFTANWNYIYKRFKSTVRAGFFNDIINYTDSLSALFSKSKVQTLMAENENYLNWRSNHQLNFGINVSSSSGQSNNYEGIRSQYRVSLLLGNKFSFINKRLSVYVSGRADYFSMGALPITGNVALEYQLLKSIALKINAAKVYRQPTLNDLYWQPGGNPDLKPEQGYTGEGEAVYKKQIGNVGINISAAAFSRQLDNWILWVPGVNGNPKPMNVQQVWSRGTETNWRVSYKRNKFNTSLGLVSGYVLSTVERQQQENSATLGRQLIYTPRYTINGHLAMGYGNLQVIYFHQYLGYRFTSSDNSSWLDPYHLSSLKANYTLMIKSVKLNLFAASNNLFSANYVILAGRTMALVNYEFGISIYTQGKTKTKS